MNRSIENILNHSLNNSRTKEAHKFPQSERFPKTFQSPCKRSSYDLDTSTSFLGASTKRSGRFGRQIKFYTTEMDIRRHSLSPSPGSYQHQDGFKLVSNKNVPSTFGKEKKLVLKADGIPGPGKYDPTKYNPEVTLSYTMRTRTSGNSSHWNAAGPGQYNLKSSFTTRNSQTDHYPLHTKIGKQKRFKDTSNGNPPPNAYHVPKWNHDITSKFALTNKYSFGRDRKDMRIKTDYPGPGTYHEFSEFYDGPYTTRR